MSMMMNMAGVYSGIAAPSGGNYLAITPNGYGDFGNRSISGNFSIMAEVKFSSIEALMPVIGSTSASYQGMHFTDGTRRLTFTSNVDSTSSARMPIGTIVADTWYRLKIFRSGTTIVLNITNADTEEVIINTVITSSSNTGPLTYNFIGRHLTSYKGMDVRRIEIGTFDEQQQHVYVAQSSGGTWTDTGTVGGQDITLAGSPLPTWE